MNKIIIVIIVIAVVISGWYFLSSQPSGEKTVQQPPVSEMPLAEPTQEQAPAAAEYVVVYTDSGYSPNTITIKKGQTVTFKNQSSSSMWPASAMHPTHRVYDGTSLEEHCPNTANSAFDACKGILPGGSWAFRFDKIGNWKYHDHLTTTYFGAIIVE
ncbi:MAG: cupredoxin domain-containing protein [Candidatus Staskawiczbacteria bacterium]|nr:cupredoxin domain-containing protein [Candidatus Staskawiczbacteria bacterium]